MTVAQRRLFREDLSGILAHRHRFTRQRCLLDPQVHALYQSDIGRDIVARLQNHYITSHQLAGRNGDPVPIAEHLGVGRRHLFQGGQCLLRPAFLYYTKDGVEDYDGHDGYGIDEFRGASRAVELTPAYKRRNDSGCNQDQHQELVELIQHHAPEATPGGLLQLVEAKTFLSLANLIIGQAPRPIAVQPSDGLIVAMRVPNRRFQFHVPQIAPK